MNKETCEYQYLRKMNFKEAFNFQRICLNKSKYEPSLKFLQTFKRIGDGA